MVTTIHVLIKYNFEVLRFLCLLLYFSTAFVEFDKCH